MADYVHQDDDFGRPWECPFCTYRNPTSLYLTCQACGQAAPEGKGRGSALSHDDIENLSDSFRRDLEGQHEMLRHSSLDPNFMDSFDSKEELVRRKSFDDIAGELDDGSMSDSFRRDIQNQEELVRHSSIGMGSDRRSGVRFKDHKTRNGSIVFTADSPMKENRKGSIRLVALQQGIGNSTAFSDSCIRDIANQEDIIRNNFLQAQASRANFQGDFSESFHRDMERQDEIIQQTVVIGTNQDLHGQFSESFHRDMENQAEIERRTLQTLSPAHEETLPLKSLTESFRRDLQSQDLIQEEIREGKINPMRKLSIDSIGTGVAIGVCVDESPTYKNGPRFDAELFCSVVSNYLAAEPQTRSLQDHEDYHYMEVEKYQSMLRMLENRKKEIEYEEGINMADAMQGASRPGVCSVSPAVLEWISHDRMLKEWDKKIGKRANELRARRQY